MITEITRDTFDAFIKSSGVVIVDVFAQWCSPCKQILKLLPRLEADLEGMAVIGKIDIDAEPALRLSLEVKKVPTFIFFKNGVEAYRFEGVLTLATIKGKVASLLAN